MRCMRTTLAEQILFYAMILGALVFFIAGAGCAQRSIDWTRTTTTRPDGTVVETNDVHYQNNGFDTASGLLTVGRDDLGNPTLTIENYTSEDQVTRTLAEGFKAMQAIAP